MLTQPLQNAQKANAIKPYLIHWKCICFENWSRYLWVVSQAHSSHSSNFFQMHLTGKNSKRTDNWHDYHDYCAAHLGNSVWRQFLRANIAFYLWIWMSWSLSSHFNFRFRCSKLLLGKHTHTHHTQATLLFEKVGKKKITFHHKQPLRIDNIFFYVIICVSHRHPCRSKRWMVSVAAIVNTTYGSLCAQSCDINLMIWSLEQHI